MSLENLQDVKTLESGGRPELGRPIHGGDS